MNPEEKASETNAQSKNTFSNISLTTSLLTLVALIVFAATQIFAFNSNFAKEDDLKDIKKSVDNLASSSGSFQTRSTVEKYISDFLLSQTVGDQSFPFAGQMGQPDKTSTQYVNQKLGFSVIVPNTIVLNTVRIDYRFGEEEPNTLFLTASNKFDYALTGSIPKEQVNDNMLVLGYVFADKAQFDSAVENFKKPIESRTVSFGKETHNGVNYDFVMQKGEKVEDGDIKIIYPDYAALSGTDYYYLFYVGGDLSAFDSEIKTMTDSLNVKKIETQVTDEIDATANT